MTTSKQQDHDEEFDLLSELEEFLAGEIPAEEEAQERVDSTIQLPDMIGHADFDKHAEYVEKVEKLFMQLSNLLTETGIPFYIALCTQNNSEGVRWIEEGLINPAPCEIVAMAHVLRLPHDFSHAVILQARAAMLLMSMQHPPSDEDNEG